MSAARASAKPLMLAASRFVVGSSSARTPQCTQNESSTPRGLDANACAPCDHTSPGGKTHQCNGGMSRRSQFRNSSYPCPADNSLESTFAALLSASPVRRRMTQAIAPYNRRSTRRHMFSARPPLGAPAPLLARQPRVSEFREHFANRLPQHKSSLLITLLMPRSLCV